MLTLLYYTLSLLSPFLLFMVQPMAAKTALPTLGGAPFVWNGCMVFFQMALLAGYLYAHLLSRLVAVKKQPFIHILLLLLLSCPIAFTGSAAFDPAQQPMLWLLMMLLRSIGLPFLVLSATSPLSQRWFAAATGGKNPYFLYSASNLGSFAGLLAYPIVIEPMLTLSGQTALFHQGFIALAGLFIIAGITILRAANAPSPNITVETAAKPSKTQIMTWVGLAFIASSLLYGVTTYIVTDIASVPLFWVIPLALYLLTFVLMFSTRPPSTHIWGILHRIGAPSVAFLALLPQSFSSTVLPLHLLIFFAAALMCNGKLARLKPPAQQLTGFYLWLSLGGVLGGIFNTFIAPLLFTDITEYPLMLLISLVAAGISPMRRPIMRFMLNIVMLWLVTAALFWLLADHHAAMLPFFANDRAARLTLLGAFIVLVLAGIVASYLRYNLQPLYYFVCVVPMLWITAPLYTHTNNERVSFVERNLFGVSRIIWLEELQAWEFRHNITNHGIQSVNASERLQRTAYYGAPLKDMFDALPSRLAMQPVGVMGMGIGIVGCYGRAGQAYDFFEINPVVETIARDTRFFTYLRDCPPTKHVIIGDGRISLNRSLDEHYGALVIDVFSSDAIPMHILTREAVAMYMQKLEEGGLLAMHITNRHIDLLPVLAAIAQNLSLHGVWIIDIPPAGQKLFYPSQWVVLAKNADAIAPLAAQGWKTLPAGNPRFLWRDDYSNILRSIRF